MMHLCIVATLCFFKIISPRNYYLATRTIFPGSMVQSVDLNLTVANVFRILYSRCQKFPYLSKYKYQQSQGNIFELKNVTGNLIAPTFNRWCLFSENPIFQEDHSRSKFSRLLLNILVQVLLGLKIINHGSTHAMVHINFSFRINFVL